MPLSPFCVKAPIRHRLVAACGGLTPPSRRWCTGGAHKPVRFPPCAAGELLPGALGLVAPLRRLSPRTNNHAGTRRLLANKARA